MVSMSEAGKHQAVCYLEIEPEFYGNLTFPSKLKVTKMTKNRPEMRQGAVYVKVKVVLDDATWKRVIPEAVVEVPLEQTGVIEVETEPMVAGPAEAEVEVEGG